MKFANKLFEIMINNNDLEWSLETHVHRTMYLESGDMWLVQNQGRLPNITFQLDILSMTSLSSFRWKPCRCAAYVLYGSVRYILFSQINFTTKSQNLQNNGNEEVKKWKKIVCFPEKLSNFRVFARVLTWVKVE